MTELKPKIYSQVFRLIAPGIMSVPEG